MIMRKALTVVGTAVLAVLSVSAPAAWAADDRLTGSITREGGYTCRGQAAVLADEDYWSATMGDDVVVALAEDVGTINLLDGDDLLCIHVQRSDSHAAVVVNAGNGNDTVVTYGGGYHDIYLDAGNDIAYLNGYNELVYGGTGNDHMWGLGGDEVFLHGEAGSDILQGSHSDDGLEGGDNGDILIGAGGNDSLSGDGGDDNIQGGTGSDTINGGANNDTCTDTFGSTTFISCETTVNSGPGGVTT
jgi:Ca2+-binding RTX toxin-like protein